MKKEVKKENLIGALTVGIKQIIIVMICLYQYAQKIVKIKLNIWKKY